MQAQPTRISIYPQPKYLGFLNGGHTFAYTIRIHNHGPMTAQLLNRHWIITHGNGGIEEVKGEGVVGEQPKLKAGEYFEYSSGAIIPTTTGSMRGSYEFTLEDGSRFQVKIPEFALMAPSAAH